MARKGIVSRSYAAARDSVSSKHWYMVYLASGMAILAIVLLVGVSGIPSISAALQAYWLAPKTPKIYFVPDAPIGRVDIDVSLNRDLSFNVRERSVKLYNKPEEVSQFSAKLIPATTGTACSGEDEGLVEVSVEKPETWSYVAADSSNKEGKSSSTLRVTPEHLLIPIQSQTTNIRKLDAGLSYEAEVRYQVGGIFRERGTLLPLITPPSIGSAGFSVRLESQEDLSGDLEASLCWGKEKALTLVPLVPKKTTLEGKVVTVWDSESVVAGHKAPLGLPEHTKLALELKPRA